MSPFDFLKAINETKEDLIVDDLTEKEYPPFMVNRGLSYFPDTVMIANEMNQNAHLDNRLQNSFLINMIRKRKRFSKWLKAEVHADVEAVKEYYGYSDYKAHQALSLLNEHQKTIIKNKVNKGGRRK